MLDEHDKTILAQRSSWIGVVGNAALAISKIFIGIISNSTAVIADGIDSATDIIGSLVTLYASKVSSTPPDKEHPWGHGRIEALATKVLAIFIIFAGFQLILTTIQSFIAADNKEIPGVLAVVITVISILGKAALSYYKFQVAKKIDSAMIKADAIHMKNDIYISLAVLIGLGLTYFTQMAIIDSMIGILLGLWVMKSGISLSLEASVELLDSVRGDDDIYLKVIDIVDQLEAVQNPHKIRIRKLNNLFDINFDLEVDGNISVNEGHILAQKVENKIKTEIPNIFDIVIHVEPIGNCEEEQFGLSSKDFTRN